jgi:hypothetical protein
MGPQQREWGFLDCGEWIHHKEFLYGR